MMKRKKSRKRMKNRLSIKLRKIRKAKEEMRDRERGNKSERER